jgi:hypothetical protein
MYTQILSYLKGTIPAFIIICLLFNTGCLKDKVNTSETVKTETTGADNKPSMQKAHHGSGDSSVFVVDQANTSLTNGFTYNSYWLGPIGQEFVPSLYAIDAIELTMDDASCSVINGYGGTLKIQLRQYDIGGKIIGISDTVYFPNCFIGVLRFDFPQFIPVSPGQTYVFEIVYVSGSTSAVTLDNGPSSLYLKGSAIFQGMIDTKRDLWFREGLDKTIARTKDQVFKKGWQTLVRKDGTRFRNQGDCIQYINSNHGPQ